MALPRLQPSAPARAPRPAYDQDEAIPGLPAPARQPPRAPEDEVELVGKLGKLLYPRDPEDLNTNPFRIMALKVGKADVTFKTVYPVTAQVGDTVSVKGKWGEYKGRRSFEANIVTLAMARDVKGQVAWMSSLPGIGKATALRIVKRWGEETNEILHEVEKVMQADVPRAKAEIIVEAWSGRYAEARCVQRLLALQFGDLTIQKAMDRYGLGIERVIEERPWELCTTLPGIGFQTADKIAMRQGHPTDSPKRVVAAIHNVIDTAVNADGHCGLPVEKVVSGACALIQMGQELVRAHLAEALKGHYSVDPMTGLASWSTMHRMEQEIAERLLDILDHPRRTRAP